MPCIKIITLWKVFALPSTDRCVPLPKQGQIWIKRMTKLSGCLNIIKRDKTFVKLKPETYGNPFAVSDYFL